MSVLKWLKSHGSARPACAMRSSRSIHGNHHISLLSPLNPTSRGSRRVLRAGKLIEFISGDSRWQICAVYIVHDDIGICFCWYQNGIAIGHPCASLYTELDCTLPKLTHTHISTYTPHIYYITEYESYKFSCAPRVHPFPKQETRPIPHMYCPSIVESLIF